MADSCLSVSETSRKLEPLSTFMQTAWAKGPEAKYKDLRWLTESPNTNRRITDIDKELEAKFRHIRKPAQKRDKHWYLQTQRS